MQTNSPVQTKFRTASVVNNPVGVASVVVLAANPNRKGFILYNGSLNPCYICFGPVAATVGTLSFAIQSATRFEMFGSGVYTGVISAIMSAGASNLAVTELT